MSDSTPCDVSSTPLRKPSGKRKGTALLHRELSVGEVARRSGLAVSAIHVYEAKGLIRSRRNAGNQRRFSRDVLRRVAIIKVAQRTGITLGEIRAAFEALPESRAPTAADWQKLSASWRQARLTQLRDQLDHCIGCGCLSMDECPLRNPEDELAEEGAGPRLLDPA